MRDIITVVDIGTTKISVAVAKINSGIEILYLNKSLSSGLKKGKIVDMEAFTSSIRRAIQDTEEAINTKLKKVVVCFSGSDIKGIYSDAAVKVRKKVITEEDVASVIELATAVQVPLDRQIVHILPVEFIIDGSNGIRDPIGMRGIRLEVKVYIVTALSSHIQNIKSCFDRLSIEVEDMIFQAISSSEAVLTEHDREVGTVLIDFGGGTTDIALFYDGHIRHTKSFSLGSNHITNDLAIGLKIPFKEAERIKMQFGVALPEISFGNISLKDAEEVEVIGLDKQPLRIPLRVIKEIVYPRCEEIFEILKEEINSVAKHLSISSAVLTGGGAQLRGLTTLAESFLSMPVRLGKPDTGIIELCSEMGWDEKVVDSIESFSPEFSSVLGGVIYTVRTQYLKIEQFQPFSLIDRFTTWLKGLIKI